MTKLRLGPIDDDKPVKLTFELRAATHRQLNDYARAHAKETGLADPLPIERLIDPMLDRFMSGDRGFNRQRRPQTK